jgi:hypothetical protein
MADWTVPAEWLGGVPARTIAWARGLVVGLPSLADCYNRGEIGRRKYR